MQTQVKDRQDASFQMINIVLSASCLKCVSNRLFRKMEVYFIWIKDQIIALVKVAFYPCN